MERLLWGNREQITHVQNTYKPFDLIIGSDLLYDPKNYRNLLSTILQLDEKDTLIIFGGTRRHLEQQFLKLAEQYYDISSQDLDTKNTYVFHLVRK